jgi:hypothetical protein
MEIGLKQAWLEALRSGAYAKGGGYLRYEEGYCAVGVLLDVSKLGTWVKPKKAPDNSKAWVFQFGASTHAMILNRRLERALGIGEEKVIEIMHASDRNETFAEVIALVEAL